MDYGRVRGSLRRCVGVVAMGGVRSVPAALRKRRRRARGGSFSPEKLWRWARRAAAVSGAPRRQASREASFFTVSERLLRRARGGTLDACFSCGAGSDRARAPVLRAYTPSTTGRDGAVSSVTHSFKQLNTVELAPRITTSIDHRGSPKRWRTQRAAVATATTATTAWL